MELEEHFGCPWYDPFKFFCCFYQKSVFDIDACCIKRDVLND